MARNTSGAPLYEEVYQSFLSLIVSNVCAEKTALTSEWELYEQFHVSRSTIRRVLDAFERDGYINKMQGCGNFLRPQMYEQMLSRFHSFSGALKAKHNVITNEILGYTLIDWDKFLGDVISAHVHETKQHKPFRLRNASGLPLMNRDHLSAAKPLFPPQHRASADTLAVCVSERLLLHEDRRRARCSLSRDGREQGTAGSEDPTA